MQMALHRLKKNRAAILGAVIVVGYIFVAAFGPFLAPYDPYEMRLDQALAAPSLAHPFGFDELGRDIFSRVIYGTRISFLISVLSVGIAMIIGVTFGTLSGYFGGTIDAVGMRAVDIMMAFPEILLALAIVSALRGGAQVIGTETAISYLIIAVGLYSIPQFIRISRASVMSVKENEYVEAARATGEGTGGLILQYILPNALAPIIVQATLRIGTAILTAAGLSFLGLGVQPPTAEWGSMTSYGRGYLRVAPYLATFPGLAIMLVVLGFNLLGDGLRDALDPRLRLE
jgi:peptide/nickel transport system permease protein